MAKEINPFIVTGKIEPMAITLSLSHPEEWVKRD